MIKARLLSGDSFLFLQCVSWGRDGGTEEEPLSDDTGKCELPQSSCYLSTLGRPRETHCLRSLIVPAIEGFTGGENILEATDP